MTVGRIFFLPPNRRGASFQRRFRRIALKPLSHGPPKRSEQRARLLMASAPLSRTLNVTAWKKQCQEVDAAIRTGSTGADAPEYTEQPTREPAATSRVWCAAVPNQAILVRSALALGMATAAVDVRTLFHRLALSAAVLARLRYARTRRVSTGFWLFSCHLVPPGRQLPSRMLTVRRLRIQSARASARG
jgi:hypothetical protein